MAWTGTILTATDLSPASDAAVARAALLARQSAATRLDLLHVMSVSGLQSLKHAVLGAGADPEAEVRAGARRAVEQLAASLAPPGLPVQIHVEIGRPQDEILRINTDARPRALQVALLIPILAGLFGLFNSFRMLRLPDPAPTGAAEGMALG